MLSRPIKLLSRQRGHSLIMRKVSTRGNKTRAYSLIELMVVLGLITIIGLTGIPNLAGSNDRASLEQNAQLIKQILIDARTRSLAPTKNDGSSTAQNYQVVFGDFSPEVTNNQVAGNANTNVVSLQSGLSQCDSGDVQAGFTEVRSIKLPRNIYLSGYYPATTRGGVNDDQKMAIRFIVGQVGFQCGKASNPSLTSTDFNNNSAWIGKRGDGSQAVARFLLLELSGAKLNEKRYVVVDRKTSEVSVTKINPQSYFIPQSDALAPKWSATEPFTLSIRCGANDSDVTISYPRASDRSVDPLVTDPNLPVYYDISWDTGGNIFRPLAISYFYDLGQNIVNFRFNTTTISTASQPNTIKIRLVAGDDYDNLQPQNNSDALLKWLEKTFNPSCGSTSVDVDEGASDIKDTKDQDDGSFQPGRPPIEAPLI